MGERQKVVTSLPARSGFSITPADVDLAQNTKALYIGVAGDLVVILELDTDPITIKDAAKGYHPLACKRVCAATAATNIVGFAKD